MKSLNIKTVRHINLRNKINCFFQELRGSDKEAFYIVLDRRRNSTIMGEVAPMIKSRGYDIVASSSHKDNNRVLLAIKTNR